MAKFAGPMIWNGKKCAFCDKEIIKGEHVIQEGFISKKWFHNECWGKYKKSKK